MKYVMLLMALLASAGAYAQTDTALDPLLATCATCHGANGISPTPLWPNLAGQKVGYLRQQLRDFRSGVRQDPQMTPQAANLSDAQIDALAAHYAALPLPPAQPGPVALDPTTPPLVFCVRCHGSDGVSPNDIWPSLAGQKVDYMRKQVHAYAEGTRANDMMAMWGGMVSAEPLTLILKYFHQQGRQIEGPQPPAE